MALVWQCILMFLCVAVCLFGPLACQIFCMSAISLLTAINLARSEISVQYPTSRRTHHSARHFSPACCGRRCTLDTGAIHRQPLRTPTPLELSRVPAARQSQSTHARPPPPFRPSRPWLPGKMHRPRHLHPHQRSTSHRSLQRRTRRPRRPRRPSSCTSPKTTAPSPTS